MPVTSNCLPLEQTARFYRIWFELLYYVNEDRHLVDSFPASPEDGSVNPADAVNLRPLSHPSKNLLADCTCLLIGSCGTIIVNAKDLSLSRKRSSS